MRAPWQPRSRSPFPWTKPALSWLKGPNSKVPASHGCFDSGLYWHYKLQEYGHFLSVTLVYTVTGWRIMEPRWSPAVVVCFHGRSSLIMTCLIFHLGAACNEDKLFLEAAGLKEKGYARKGCATQLPGFNSSTKVSTGEGALLGFMILVVFLLVFWGREVKVEGQLVVFGETVDRRQIFLMSASIRDGLCNRCSTVSEVSRTRISSS